MLLTTVVLLIARHQFNPDELASQYLFVIIGLEIGLRFTQVLLRQILRLVPGIVLATIAVTSASSLVAYALSVAAHIPFLDAYLATTPGGINAVLAVAASAHAQLTIISTAQTLRLFVIVLLMPIFLRWLANRHKPAALPSCTAADRTRAGSKRGRASITTPTPDNERASTPTPPRPQQAKTKTYHESEQALGGGGAPPLARKSW
jgi:membrane AbrB-like protein